MTLTYKLDLDIPPLDLHAKIQVHTSVHPAGIVRHQIDTGTHDAETITCTRVTRDVKISIGLRLIVSTTKSKNCNHKDVEWDGC